MGYEIDTREPGFIEFTEPIRRKEIKRISFEVAEIFQDAHTTDNARYEIWYSGKISVIAEALDDLQRKMGDKIKNGRFVFSGEDLEIWKWGWNADSHEWEEAEAVIGWRDYHPIKLEKYY